MKNFFKKLLGITTAFAIVGGATMSSAEAKSLVVYYSATGNTKIAALKIAALTKSDVLELVPAHQYTDAALDYTDKSSRVCRENTDKSIRDNTLVTATVKDFDSYDTIFVGYPIWWDTYAWPVDGFLGVNNLQGKTIYPFCTSGGSSVDGSVASLRANYKDAKIVDGMRIYRNTSASEIQNWIDSQKQKNRFKD